MVSSAESAVHLNNGVKIPRLGFGVYQIPAGPQTFQAVTWALEAGYRHIDTARIYGNEASLGEALRASGIPRESVFVTTKLWNSDQGSKSTIKAFQQSLRKLGFDAIDLYLMHWPVQSTRLKSWKAMETILSEGKCRAIGVSNFMVRHLDELLESSDVVPTVNQIELHPYIYRSRLDVVERCREAGIQLEAYCPLTQGQRLTDPKLVKLAAKYRKTTAQILLRWSLQKDFVVIPKSVSQARIIENSQIFDFELSPEDMDRLDGFDENLVCSWDPTEAP